MLGRKVAGFLAVLFLAACNGSDRDLLDERPGSDSGAKRDPGLDGLAVARIEAKSGSTVSGEATLTEQEGGVEIVLRLANAPPGAHAVHLHEHGDCSAPDAGTAGAHWNPSEKPHGKRGTGAFHAGDIGNIEIGPDGTGTLSLIAGEWSLDATASVDPVGKAVIVHAMADDFVTQPDGGGGEKIGCGVIEIGKEVKRR